jgi:hypothetical protein
VTARSCSPWACWMRCAGRWVTCSASAARRSASSCRFSARARAASCRACWAACSGRRPGRGRRWPAPRLGRRPGLGVVPGPFAGPQLALAHRRLGQGLIGPAEGVPGRHVGGAAFGGGGPGHPPQHLVGVGPADGLAVGGDLPGPAFPVRPVRDVTGVGDGPEVLQRPLRDLVGGPGAQRAGAAEGLVVQLGEPGAFGGGEVGGALDAGDGVAGVLPAGDPVGQHPRGGVGAVEGLAVGDGVGEGLAGDRGRRCRAGPGRGIRCPGPRPAVPGSPPAAHHRPRSAPASAPTS